jgi:hypothetical protein
MNTLTRPQYIARFIADELRDIDASPLDFIDMIDDFFDLDFKYAADLAIDDARDDRLLNIERNDEFSDLSDSQFDALSELIESFIDDEFCILLAAHYEYAYARILSDLHLI